MTVSFAWIGFTVKDEGGTGEIGRKIEIERCFPFGI